MKDILALEPVYLISKEIGGFLSSVVSTSKHSLGGSTLLVPLNKLTGQCPGFLFSLVGLS